MTGGDPVRYPPERGEPAHPLRRDVVLVWYLPLGVLLPVLRGGYEGRLDEAEREKASRFRREEDRCHYLAAHALLRQMLTVHAGTAPQDWRFDAGPHGRPELAAGQTPLPIRFSLSHTQGMVACAMTLERAIGVDVEATTRRATDIELVASHFAPHEIAMLKACAAERRWSLFLDLWTLKEAYVKALGLGLSARLDAFAVEPDPPRLRFTRVGAGRPDWQLQLFRPSSRHRLAVALQAEANHAITWRCAEVDAALLLPRQGGAVL
jgi:4'-phosphopantetheinyl transferase